MLQELNQRVYKKLDDYACKIVYNVIRKKKKKIIYNVEKNYHYSKDNYEWRAQKAH